MTFLNKQEVELKLSQIGYGKPFKVVFFKKDESERCVEQAMMEKPKKPLNPNAPVPVMNLSDGGWSSFYTSRVKSIEELGEV